MKSFLSGAASGIYLRAAISAAYLWEVADRIGILGAPGSPHVGWGNWDHFLDYARQVMSFLPAAWVPVLAVFASFSEAIIGLMLLFGLFTRQAAIASAMLSFCFGTAMAISFGIESPLGYSVFTLSAASVALAGFSQYPWSIDAMRPSQKVKTVASDSFHFNKLQYAKQIG